MSKPSEHSLILASIALIDLAEMRGGREGDCYLQVADYLLRLSTLQELRSQSERKPTSTGSA